MFFGFYLTLYKLISLAISFLFVFRLLLAPPCSVLPKKSFGGTLFACYLYLLFCSPNRNYTSYSSCKRRALTHNLSVCHGTQECGSLLVACSFSSVCCVLALQRSCLVQLEHLYSGPSLSLCCPTPQHPVQTEPAPCPTFHSLL